MKSTDDHLEGVEYLNETECHKDPDMSTTYSYSIEDLIEFQTHRMLSAYFYM